MRSMFPWPQKRRSAHLRERALTPTEYLQRVDILQDLSKEEIHALFSGVMTRECPPDAIFFAPDDAAERLFILKVGLVELYRIAPSGRRLVIRRIGPGTAFGEMGLMSQSMQGCFAEAREPSLVCIATRQDIERVLRERPEVGLRMLETIGKYVNTLEERLEQAVFSPVKARLARFLLANMDATTGTVQGFTHEEIGDTIGALRQTVTETLNDMQRLGWLEVGHKVIHVICPTELEALNDDPEAAESRRAAT